MTSKQIKSSRIVLIVTNRRLGVIIHRALLARAQRSAPCLWSRSGLPSPQQWCALLDSHQIFFWISCEFFRRPGHLVIRWTCRFGFYGKDLLRTRQRTAACPRRWCRGWYHRPTHQLPADCRVTYERYQGPCSAACRNRLTAFHQNAPSDWSQNQWS